MSTLHCCYFMLENVNYDEAIERQGGPLQLPEVSIRSLFFPLSLPMEAHNNGVYKAGHAFRLIRLLNWTKNSNGLRTCCFFLKPA